MQNKDLKELYQGFALIVAGICLLITVVIILISIIW